MARLSNKHNAHFTDKTLSWIHTHWNNYIPTLPITILSFQQTHHKRIRRP